MKTIQYILIFILAVLALSLISSRSANPDNSYLFSLKRIQEKAYLSITSSPKDRVEYMRVVLENRLKELSSVVNNKKYGEVLKSSSRYFTLAGQITEVIEANNLKDLVEPTKSQFENHYKILEKLYIIYPKNIPDNVEWKYIQDDYNYLKIYLDKLSSLK